MFGIHPAVFWPAAVVLYVAFSVYAAVPIIRVIMLTVGFLLSLPFFPGAWLGSMFSHAISGKPIFRERQS